MTYVLHQKEGKKALLNEVPSKQMGDELKCNSFFENSSLTLSEQAFNWQGMDAYPLMDKYENVKLDKGTLLGCLVIPDGTDSNGYKRGSYYFPITEEIQKLLDKPDFTANELCEKLQIKPWKNPSTKEYEYKNHVAVFRTSCDIEVARGNTLANPHYGEGNWEQIYIPTDNTHFPANFEVNTNVEVNEKSPLQLVEMKTLVRNNLSDMEFGQKIDDKHEYALTQRNYCCYLKVKADLLQVAQNSQDQAISDKAKGLLPLLETHIEKYIDFFTSTNVKLKTNYTSLLNYLNIKVNSLEGENTLFLADEKKESEIKNFTDNIFEKVNADLHKEESQRQIDVKDLKDAFDVHQLNTKHIQTEQIDYTKSVDYGNVKSVTVVAKDGSPQVQPIDKVFSPVDGSMDFNLSNGKLSPLVQIEGDEAKSKILAQGKLLLPIQEQSRQQLIQNLKDSGFNVTNGLLSQLAGGIKDGSNTTLKLDKDLNRLLMVSPNKNIIPLFTKGPKQLNVLTQSLNTKTVPFLKP